MLSAQTHRRPGLHAPAYVVARLKRFHPQVSLAWDADDECWALVAHDHFNAHTVIHKLRRFCGPDRSSGARPARTYWVAEAPTLANTVWYLDKCDSRRWENESMRQAWLDDVDSHGPHEEAKQSESLASARIEEGADRMWRLAGKRVPFGNLFNRHRGSGTEVNDVNPTDGATASRPSPPENE